MPSVLLARHQLGSIVARYLQASTSKGCELQLVPLSREHEIKAPRETIEDRPEIAGLPAKFKPLPADSPQSLVQVKLREDDAEAGFASGVTLLGSPTVQGLRYLGQDTRADAQGVVTIATTLRDQAGRFYCVHRLIYLPEESVLRSTVEFVNTSAEPLSLQLLGSFAINGLTPFSSENSTAHLHFHRFRSWWSLEGRLDSASLQSLHLERSWGGYGVLSERIGQTGTMPVRHWFSTAAVEDRTAGVVWAAQLAWAGSWQMELMRRGDRVCLCGGLADWEFGHWSKTISPGETFTSPEAFLTVVSGSLDDACHALLDGQRSAIRSIPPAERDLPIVFNEWCTSWGSPGHDNILAIARRLQGSGVRYIVIDDGWARRPPEAVLQSNGDWIVDEAKFPGGLKPTCDALRALGYIPGIWFEFEVVNPDADAWREAGHFLQRDGRPLKVGPRRFWDLRDPWVADYLQRKVIDLLRDNGIGYLKVDYNDSVGLGCDHADSLGEGLRSHVEGIHRFFRRLRAELPDLVIENCSSGGHRLEPSMQALASMGSFSDAHEAVIIPIIARNLQRLILPRQSLIWAVLHRSDNDARLHYSLAATFLGRLCLSGDIHDLEPRQFDIMRRALAFYPRVAGIIDRGVSVFHGTADGSYVDPRGWQAVVRVHGDDMLVVCHGFDQAGPLSCAFPLPAGAWKIDGQFCEADSGLQTSVEATAHLTLGAGFRGGAWLLRREFPSLPADS